MIQAVIYLLCNIDVCCKAIGKDCLDAIFGGTLDFKCQILQNQKVLYIYCLLYRF